MIVDEKYVLDESLRADFLPPRLQRPLLVVRHASLVGRVQVIGPVSGGGGGGPVRMGKCQRAVALVNAGSILRAVDDDVGGSSSAVAEMAAAGGLKLAEWGFLGIEFSMITKKVGISPLLPPPLTLWRRGSPLRRSSPSWWSACGT